MLWKLGPFWTLSWVAISFVWLSRQIDLISWLLENGSAIYTMFDRYQLNIFCAFIQNKEENKRNLLGKSELACLLHIIVHWYKWTAECQRQWFIYYLESIRCRDDFKIQPDAWLLGSLTIWFFYVHLFYVFSLNLLRIKFKTYHAMKLFEFEF